MPHERCLAWIEDRELRIQLGRGEHPSVTRSRGVQLSYCFVSCDKVALAVLRKEEQNFKVNRGDPFASRYGLGICSVQTTLMPDGSRDIQIRCPPLPHRSSPLQTIP